MAKNTMGLRLDKPIQAAFDELVARFPLCRNERGDVLRALITYWMVTTPAAKQLSELERIWRRVSAERKKFEALADAEDADAVVQGAQVGDRGSQKRKGRAGA